MMNMSLSSSALLDYVMRLIALHFPDEDVYESPSSDFALALERCEYCFSKIKKKFYYEDSHTVFNHLNADHMASFLYFLSNSIWKNSCNVKLASKIYYLNKIMNGLDLFYSVEMPDIFCLVHPLGSVVGNAKYSDYLVIYQNCTIGSNGEHYPVIGNGVVLYSGSSVIGNCKIGSDVVFGANSFVINFDVPSNSLVLGIYPNCRVIENQLSVYRRCFDSMI